MPSNLPTNESPPLPDKGTLYVVAMPIGNRDDITFRALEILREADLIAAEDTRHTRRFLADHAITCRLISYHEHNEDQRTEQLIRKLENGTSIALVSNAGTPSVSDPGYRLIERAIAKHINVVPIPGVSAVVAALSASGLPTDSFVFVGFLSKKKTKRLKQIEELAAESRTIIIYESPKRILALLQEMITPMGCRQVVVAREITKLHEEFLRGPLADIITMLKQRPEIKGECTLVVAGRREATRFSWEETQREIASAVETKREKTSALARRLAKKYRLPKKKIYEEVLRLSQSQAEGRHERNE